MDDLKLKIKNLVFLKQNDKNLLIDALNYGYEAAEAAIPTLSIFSNKYVQHVCGHYSFLETLVSVQYLRSGNMHLGIFLDGDGKYIPYSRYYFSNLIWFVNHIDNVIKNTNIMLSKCTQLDVKRAALGCEKWFITYGHFQDECFNIASFCNKFHDPNALVVLDYPSDSELDTENFTHNSNYLVLDNLLFNRRSINAHQFKNECLLFDKLYLIKNSIKSPTFHSFPIEVTNYLRFKCNTQVSKILLTRSKSYRDISNKSAVEGFVRSKGFSIVNPELVSLNFLIQILGNADEILLYWGSAMTNLVYCPIGAKVVVLQSDSYCNEDLSLWDKMLEPRSFDLSVIKSEANHIEIEKLSAFI